MTAPRLSTSRDIGHKPWVRLAHGVVTLSFFSLAFSGFVILMCHPRLYWGEVGNDLTPALIELPISRNYKHGGWDAQKPFFDNAGSAVTSSRTYQIFNKNGWGRSLHFLSAWFLVTTGTVYLLGGFITRHFRKHLLPKRDEFTPASFLRDVTDHIRMRIPSATAGPQYGLLQKCSYLFVIFVLMPLIVVTGLTMSPAITASYPFLLAIFGGVQSARTIHFFTSDLLVLFMLVHVGMIIISGFKQQIRAMTIGKSYEKQPVNHQA
jgi:thiosulfate reductase cytochrome b subunit